MPRTTLSPPARRLVVLGALPAFVLVGLALVLAIYGEWRMRSSTRRFVAVYGPPDLARYERPEVPAAENAATWLLAGAGAFVPSQEYDGFMRRRDARPGSWTTGELAVAASVSARHEAALELLRRAAGCTRSSYSIDYRAGPEAELPPLGDLLRAAGLLWLDARLALETGDTPRLRLDLAALDRLAGSLASESLVVTALVSGAVDRVYLDLVHRLVTAERAEESLLAEIEAALAGRDRRADARRALGAEGSMIGSLTVEELTEAGGRRPGGRILTWVSRPIARLLVAAAIDDFSDLGELLERPWPEVVALSEARLERGFPGSFAAILYPNLIDAIGKRGAGESALRLALEAIRQRRAALAGLGYRAGPEAAWVDPYTGKPVVVEARPDGTLLLEAPGALELWRERSTVRSRTGDLHFTWVLPAPG